MAAKYYTHFTTAGVKAARQAPSLAEAGEWSGVVELRRPLEKKSGTKQLKALLAQSFDLSTDDIKILHWARLH